MSAPTLSHAELDEIERVAKLSAPYARIKIWATEALALLTMARRTAEAEAELADERAYALRLQITLTGLAGGGSENFVRHGDGFRADIDFCRTRIIQRAGDGMEFGKKQMRRVKAAEAETARLHEQVAFARRDALEEAAKVASGEFEYNDLLVDAGQSIAAAIRALAATTETREDGR